MFVSFLVQPLSILIEAPVDIRDLALDGLIGVNVDKGPLGDEVLLVDGLHLYLLLFQLLSVLNEAVLDLTDHLLGDPSAVPVDLRGELV